MKEQIMHSSTGQPASGTQVQTWGATFGLTQVGAGVCEQFSRTEATQVVPAHLVEEQEFF